MEFLISPSELKKILTTAPASITLLDVREPEEYAESRIEGCTLIPLNEVLSRAPKELDPNADIVIYCAHGVRSQHALMALHQAGFKRLRSLEGGICAWEELNSPRS
jgi:rhodanese-related sulfurtransferase